MPTLRKFSVFIMLVFSSLSWADELVTTIGYGDNWGNTAVDDAKEEALQLAKSRCNSEVLQVGEWEVIILNHKEGKFRVSASSQFKCL